MQKTGIVEKIEFTQGGAGNQWTSIDGVKYATYWDALTVDWKVGDKVTFVPCIEPLWAGDPCIPHAYRIHKAPTGITEAEFIERAALRYSDKSGISADQAIVAARALWDDGKVLGDFVINAPEDLADQDMSYWDDDGDA